MTALDQSILSAAWSSSSNSSWSFSQTPAKVQSRSRLQHVDPLPQPISLGRLSQGMPVRSTKRIPARQRRSSVRLRPGNRNRRRGGGGRRGSMIAQSRSSTSAFAICRSGDLEHERVRQRQTNHAGFHFARGSKVGERVYGSTRGVKAIASSRDVGTGHVYHCHRYGEGQKAYQ
jgi:hypothetical protein